MAVNPHKPIESMTKEELREWEAWLLEEGKSPRAFTMPRSLSGSTFGYDDQAGEVAEYASDGSRYVVAFKDGQIARVDETIGESLKTP